MLEFHILDRNVISITGPDVNTFLNGIITQDISKAATGNAIYTLQLTAKGRYFSDFFLIPIENGFLIDVSSLQSEKLIEFLNKYKLRSKVDIALTNKIVAWNPLNIEGTIGTIKNNSTTIIYNDPRLDLLGCRIISNNNTAIEAIGYKQVKGFDIYKQLRFQLGILESTELWSERSIPIEWGLDDLNAISYNKGCYMGQELTHAMKHKNEPRYRLLPFTYDSTDETIANKIAKDTDDMKGNCLIISLTKGIGVGLLQTSTQIGEVQVENHKLNFYIPSWKSK